MPSDVRACEQHTRFIGYGAILMESFVVAAAVSQMGFVITPEIVIQTANDVGEISIISRGGGAPTLAVGMATILGGKALMAFGGAGKRGGCC